jgi:hypothetical protein
VSILLEAYSPVAESRIYDGTLSFTFMMSTFLVSEQVTSFNEETCNASGFADRRKEGSTLDQ